MVVEKNNFGYYSVIDMPNQEDLKNFYENKYFQNDGMRYDHTYTHDELTFMENKAKVADYILNIINNKPKKSILDVGSGEGFFAKYFFSQTHSIKTLDFSSFAISHHNPELIETLQQGDIFDSLDDVINNQEKYDLINLSNVLEHVIDPIELLGKLKLLLQNDSLLRISVPNDYSEFQNFLLEKEYTTNTWLCPPEHLHYFTFESLKNLLISLDYDIEVCMGEFPIELFLTNKESNYVHDTTKGKAAHTSRVETDNFLFNQGIEPYINFYKASAQLGFSRQIVIFAKLKN